MKEWALPAPANVPPELEELVGGHPLVAETLVRRGFSDPDKAAAFLDPAAYIPTPATDLPDLDKAVEILEPAIAEKKAICVWGDFDVDGQTATSLLVSALRSLGANVFYHIPLRHKESHGINLEVLKELIATGMDILLTCDTGISEHESIDYAIAQGVQVVITDHHALPETLPNAHAVVNSRRLPEDHPLSSLPGVGVAYKLVEELLRRADRLEEASTYLDLVALGIVADVAEQRGDARYLLQLGLEVLRTTERPGLQELMRVAEVQPLQLTETDINFQIAPRLNALGRLGDANSSVEFFTTDDITKARILAQDLEGLNSQRQLLTRQVLQGALSQIERDPTLLEHNVLVLEHPHWPGGVLGLVANKLAERYQRPAILLSYKSDEIAAGSARSVEGIDITAAITKVSDLLIGYGGHPMAAGMSLLVENVSTFRRRLSKAVAEQIETKDLVQEVRIDAELPWDELDEALIEDVERLAPFGAGNPALIFMSRDLQVTKVRDLGKTGEHLQVTVVDKAGVERKVFWWGGAGFDLPTEGFDLAFHARTSMFREQRELRVEWLDARYEEIIVEEREEELPFDLVDLRGVARPQEKLAEIIEQEAVTVWVEGEAGKAVSGLDRTEVEESETLAIYTLPPDRSTLSEIIARTKPQKVYLFGNHPKESDVNSFLQRLGGAVKFAVNTMEGKISLEKLAAVTAQTPVAVRLGLAWFEARGDFLIRDLSDAHVQIKAYENEQSIQNTDQILASLSNLINESRSYRDYLRAIPPDVALG
ncbi:MAG: single-stranded-DNA-specific exonuclease RecJ [Chloroflexi bacterium]|nr:MAG: single-stranded-DNA-specific exonuclease RecJ [Chloroflexota bacterium]MBL1195158.1 single-stranded-DNA-specific exonuclease RecJ [Chloroflexota bacterium]NOH12443.1 single-stranded-DNA-specific exonuclease RecJ [Chloroflexota bacterium]